MAIQFQRIGSKSLLNDAEGQPMLARMLILSLAVQTPVPAPAPPVTAAAEKRLTAFQLKADLAALSEAIELHPDVGHSVAPTALTQAVRAIDARISGPLATDEAWQLLATLNPVLADAHFFVGFEDWRSDTAEKLAGGGTFFPFEVHVDEVGRLFIVSQLGGTNSTLKGMRVVTINGQDARAVNAELMTRVHGDTPAFRRALLSRRWWLYYWKSFGGPKEFGLKLSGTGPSSVMLAGSNALPKVLADEASFERQFRFELIGDQAALLTVGSFSWPNKAQFLEFTRKAFASLKAARVRTLIIDVRENGGGNDDMWIDGILPYIATKPYRWASGYKKRVLTANLDAGEHVGDILEGPIDRWIPPQPQNPLRYSGDTVVLIGPSTYSSAVLFGNVVQQFGFGTIAGVGNAARRRQSGNARKFVLPHTGLSVWVPRFVLAPPTPGGSPLLSPDRSIDDDPFDSSEVVRAVLSAANAEDEPTSRQ